MELPKIVAAGIYDASLAAKNKGVTKKRKASMFEVEFVIDSGGISYMDGRAYPVLPQRVLCAKPGAIRYTKPPFRCFYVHFLARGPLYDILMNTPDYFETREGELYEKLFQRLLEHYARLSEKEELLLQSILLELIYTIKNDGERPEKKGSFFSPMIEEVIEFIRENPTEELNLEALAKKWALSPVYFHNLFKASVGKTLRDFVEEERIKKAISQMQIGRESLTKIALDSGFSSQSYFSFVFKRRMGMTPREYMKKSLEQYER